MTPWHPAFLVAPLFVTIPITAFLVAYLYRRRGLDDFPIMLLVSAATVWATAYGLEVLVPGLERKMTAVTFEYVGIVFVPVGWLLLGLHLSDQRNRLKGWMVPLLLIVPLATVAQALLWRTSEFFWTSQELVQYGRLDLIAFDYGPGFWIHISYSYLLQLLGAVLIVGSIIRSNAYYTRQRVALIFALLLPWMANVIYIFKLTPSPIDFTPLFIVIGASIIAVGVLRFGLGELLPIAREKIFSEMREGVMLFDEHQRLIDVNGAALRLFATNDSTIGLHASQLFGSAPDLRNLLLNANAPAEEILYRTAGSQPFSVRRETIHRSGRIPCQMLIFNDLSVGNQVDRALRLVVESTSADTGEEFFRSLTRSLAQALGAPYAVIGELDEAAGQITTLTFWSHDRFVDNITYDIHGTPCEKLLMQRVALVPDRVAEQFPQDDFLRDLGVRSYIGLRLTGFNHRPIGNLVVMKDAPFANPEACTSVLEVFAIRAAAELERRRSEIRLAESEARYRRIVETTRDGVCTVDARGRIEFLNEPMALLIGRPKSELVGARLDTQVAFSSTPNPLSVDDDTVEAQIVRPDGTTLWVVISKTVVQNGADGVFGMLMMFTDVTEFRLLQEHNTQIERQLQHAQKLESLGVLAGGIAHDFNNLLMPVVGYLDLIEDRSGDDAQAVEYVGRMRDAASKLTNLCKQMLTYSGKGHSAKRTLDLNEVLERLKELVRASTSKSMQIDYALHAGLVPVRADETQIDQILINLVMNAAESMDDQPSGRICISTGQRVLDAQALKSLSNGESISPGEYVYVEVRDQGKGIAEADITRLFEPFFTTKFTGRGLGMSVVFGIVRDHAGAIEVESSAGVGTTIRIYFPTTTTASQRPDSSPHPALNRRARGLILVVDDEAMVREIVTSMLESAGYEVVCAADGKLGYEAFLAHASRLAGCVIDVTMPGRDGYDLVRDIRRARDDLPIVLASGYPLRAGYSDTEQPNVTFLQKPFDMHDVINALDSVGDDAAANG